MLPLTALMGFLLLSGTPARAMVPEALAQPSYPVTLTAYNAVAAQTDSNPHETASGAYSNPEVVAARSRNLADELPFGTIIEIDGSNASKDACGYGVVAPIIGYRVIADTMNARFADRIDILFGTKSNYTMSDGKVKNAGMVLGICQGVTVRVVGFVDIDRIPKTQAELVKIVKSPKSLALK